MTRKMMLGLLLSGIGLFLSSSLSVQAASTDTKGKIDFFSNTDPAVPIDPTDPAEPLVPLNPSTQGPLSISYVTNLSFGRQISSISNQTYYAENASVAHQSGRQKELPNFIQISDNSGSNQGWKLYVAFDQPLTSISSGHQIAGVTMTFNNMTALSHDGFTEQLLQLNQGVTANADTQEPVLVAEARAKKGQGLWTLMFGNTLEMGKTSVALTVPGESEKKPESYTTSLTWSMVNGL